MSREVRAILVVLPIAAVGGAGVWAGLWYRSRAVTPAALVKRIPASDALVVYLDFDALRRRETFCTSGVRLVELVGSHYHLR